MKCNGIGRLAALGVSAGIGVAITIGAAPAHADPQDSSFEKLLDSGITGIDPATLAEVGGSVCPMLADRGQNLADVAGQVADELGRPLGPAAMFTGLAISVFCPGAMANIANGQSPIPLGMLGL
jgi:Protein of unknown function (DUF732)